MRFRFWLFVARFFRSCMAFCAKRAMKADPRVCVVSTFSEAVLAMRAEAAKSVNVGKGLN